MSKLLTTLQFWFDYTVGYMLTKEYQRPLYHRRMWETYGTRYCTKEDFDAYWKSVDDDPTSYYMNQDD